MKNSPLPPLGLHWFRRDLRIAGNKALRFNWKKCGGRTLGLFCFDSKFLARADFSSNRFAFFLKTLAALKTELRLQGGDLLVVDCDPLEAFAQLNQYFQGQKLQAITWNRDYEPFARSRDEKVRDFLQGQNIEIATFRDHLIFEPYEILKSENKSDYYKIYSPYAKKWFSSLQSEKGQERLDEHKRVADYYENLKKGQRTASLFKITWDNFLNDPAFPFSDQFEKFENENKKHITIPIPEAGPAVAFQALLDFQSKIQDYKKNRDIPSLSGTSKLSLYLKNGSLISSQIVSQLKLHHVPWESESGENQFVKEIAWREFYYSILFHRPDVESRSFQPQYVNLKWENSKALFNHWQEGTTGFPIVDAGMRELLQTGWMHNRVRMIVASFLTKDLLVDWKWGENHFMKYLLDGDLAPNNGGWQWAASTGCDPQPYFRIFNPWLQSEKFDPDGLYIKKFVPELAQIPAKALHIPDADRGRKYPRPVVDHKIQKVKALALYKLVP
jgi:deoxyribodipyrimidine photo-lyase